MNILRTNPIVRQLELNKITGNLGKVVEDNCKITCYVKKSKITRGELPYYINFIRPNNIKKENPDEIEKPICFVIENMKFDLPVYIKLSDEEIIIKNCSFDYSLEINTKGNCCIENSIFKLSNGLLDIKSKELVFNNINISVADNNRLVRNLHAYNRILANKIDINNLNVEDKTNWKIEAKETLNISNSKIHAFGIICGSKTIIMDKNSLLGRCETIVINTENYNQLNIDSNTIFLNGQKVEKELKESKNEIRKVKLTKEVDPLSAKRVEFIDLLRKIKQQCEDINDEEILEYEEKIYKRPIGTIKKRK